MTDTNNNKLIDEVNQDDIWMASKRGDVERVKAFLDAAGMGAINSPDPNTGGARTPLYNACYCNHGDLVDYLLSNGAVDERAYMSTPQTLQPLLKEHGVGLTRKEKRPPRGQWRRNRQKQEDALAQQE